MVYLRDRDCIVRARSGEIAELAGLHRNTITTALTELVDAGMARQHNNGGWQITIAPMLEIFDMTRGLG